MCEIDSILPLLLFVHCRVISFTPVLCQEDVTIFNFSSLIRLFSLALNYAVPFLFDTLFNYTRPVPCCSGITQGCKSKWVNRLAVAIQEASHLPVTSPTALLVLVFLPLPSFSFDLILSFLYSTKSCCCLNKVVSWEDKSSF